MIRATLSFVIALGASMLCAFVEVILRCAIRQPGLVLHNYEDVFNRARRIHAALNKPRATKRAYSRKPRKPRKMRV